MIWGSLRGRMKLTARARFARGSKANCGVLRPCTQGDFLLLAQEKVTKEKGAPEGPNSPECFRFRPPSSRDSTSVCCTRGAPPGRAPSGLPAENGSTRAGPTGVQVKVKGTALTDWVPWPLTFLPPMARPGLRAERWRARRGASGRRRLARGAGAPSGKLWSARPEVPGVFAPSGACFLSVPFLCTNKEREPWVRGGATRIQTNCARRAHEHYQSYRRLAANPRPRYRFSVEVACERR